MTYKRFSYSITQSVFTIVFKKKKKIKEEKNKRIKINKIEEKYSQKERKKENKLLNRPRKAQNRLVLTERNFMAKV